MFANLDKVDLIVLIFLISSRGHIVDWTERELKRNLYPWVVLVDRVGLAVRSGSLVDWRLPRQPMISHRYDYSRSLVDQCSRAPSLRVWVSLVCIVVPWWWWQPIQGTWSALLFLVCLTLAKENKKGNFEAKYYK